MLLPLVSCTESYQDSGGNVYHIERTCITKDGYKLLGKYINPCDSPIVKHVRQN